MGTRAILSKITPVGPQEFFHMFQRCVPLEGWDEKIAVAHSGGADSTCLLFLLHRMVSDLSNSVRPLPTSVVSLSVDHDLQPSSADMTAFAARSAAAIGVPHHTGTIPWDTRRFPPRPKDGTVESTARDARYDLLFALMRASGTRVIAFGHHADDQIETSLMRLSRGTTELGAGGMRRVRRWGMGFGGGNGDLGWAGYAGMSRWIVRPLLEIGKDRILATCEENKLEYVNDPTNFQPEMTLRNAVRQMLDRNFRDEDVEAKLSSDLPDDIQSRLQDIRRAAQSLTTVSYDVSGGREQLQGAVKFLSTRVEDIDSKVTSALRARSLPTVPSTFLLSTRNIYAITDPIVRAALVLRILRFISFQPWGSLRADANRRRQALNRVISSIWHPNPHTAGFEPFTVGAGVQWTPMGIDDDKVQRVSVEPGRVAWLASRVKPFSAKRQRTFRLKDRTHVDVTVMLLDNLTGKSEQDGIADVYEGPEDAQWRNAEILWDNRFLVRFHVDRLPVEVVEALRGGEGRFTIAGITKWTWPAVKWEREGKPTLVFARFSIDEDPRGASTADWVTMEWVRLLDAT